MAYNYKKMMEEESTKKYPFVMNGKKYKLTENEIGKIIKKTLRKDRAVVKMFDKFKVSLDQLDDLEICIEKLDKMFAQTDSQKMILDEGLFKGDEDWFEKNYVVITHEILHAIYRNHEQNFGYFGDHEEKESFQLSVSSLLAKGESLDSIFNKIFPKIEFHFSDPHKAREFFNYLLLNAKKFLNS